ncbi:serine--tRNA ligase [Pseudoclavibacter endophyticus]|uniref:Serine--tRNA ligase n=1 Tax=Pseudoclavibacter endophyticus TaxID=1778590 RepID=A0A6H9WDI3_9MICO|nr:serine--tRNA ligase [Pseudoclavibacter endophyticus]KAB1648969.1 serine--tRNA ligase [Pseudoclavibacter endophyticus]GGA66660.1 serine--tRNA ligase [Pseudoclavibacter endophyticus]
MIDPQVLRDNPDQVRRSQAARGNDPALVEAAIEADARRRAAISDYESLRAEQNAASKRVAAASKEDKPAILAEVKELAGRVKTAEQAAKDADHASAEALGRIQNLIIEGIPEGGEENFATLKVVGEKPAFDFDVRDHLEIGEGLRAIDVKRGTKVSGARFYYLRGIGARLELALMTMALDKALANGFTMLTTPTLVKPEIMAGTGFLGEHADEVYFVPGQDLYLTGTSEVALAGYHADEIIDVADGPVRYAGWSTCYRSEAGSYGKDTRGIIRVHQFNKLEMFSYCDPAEAEAEHERLLGWQEEMLQELGLHYRVIDTAAGDLGSSAARKFDIEAWVPTQGAYRELTSTSNCTTFQARRLQTRFRGESGKTAPVATLNGTLATTRWLVAILETHQRADGSVVIPASLRPYLGGLEVAEVTA